MKTVLLSIFLVFCLNGAMAQEILRIDFAGEEGYGWQNGVMHFPDGDWSLDGSGFLSTAGSACVNSSGFFSVTGCRGAFVFRTRKISLKDLPGVQVSVKVGEELPDQRLEFAARNVSDNRMELTTDYPSGAVVKVVTAITKDSAFAEIRVSHLSESSHFGFGGLVMAVLEEGKAEVVCEATQDTLLLYAASPPLRLPFKIRNHDKSEQVLAIRQVEFQADTNLSAFITAAKLYGGEGVMAEGILSDRQIRFYQTSGLCQIPYGDSLELILELTPYRYLVRDQQLLNLHFSEKSFGYATGSCKISEAEKCLIPPLKNEVTATVKHILKYPYTWQEEVALIVGGCDEDGNIDRKVASDYEVVVWDENGDRVMVADSLFIGPGVVRLALPVRRHYDITLNGEDPVHVSGAVERPVYEEHFEQMPSGWLGDGSWKTEEGRLQHALDDVSGVSWFMQAVDDTNYRDKNLVWSVALGNQGWLSSSVNYFRYYLLSDTTGVDCRKALYFTVDAASKEELLVLEVSGKRDTIWRGGRPWLANEAYVAEIAYLTSGEWEVRLGLEKEEVWRVGKAMKLLPANFFNDRMYSGILFKHTSPTRGGKLWVDDLGLKCFDAKGAFVRYEVVADRGVRLDYTGKIADELLTNVENYELLFRDAPFPLDSVKRIGSSSVFLFAGLKSGDYVLNVKAMRDHTMGVIPPVTIRFTHLRAVAPGDVVVNEVMFKLSKEMGLPSQKYIELYNLREEDLLLDSVVMRERGKIRGYLCDTIKANDYLIVGGSGITELAGYGRVNRMTGFSLLNDSVRLALARKSGEFLDSIGCDLSWIRDKQKRNGGYSLEKIIPEVVASDLTHWYESVAPAGGTPGRQNSVYRDCPDKVAPYLLSCKPEEGRVLLLFSEPLYDLTVMERQHYLLSDGYGAPERITWKENQVTLFYNREFQGDWDYSLQISGLTDGSGNRMRDTTALFFVAPEVAPEDVVFSELMYEADPTEAKYIELYNRSDKRIDLSMLWLAKWNERRQISTLRAIADSCVIFSPGTIVWVCAVPDVVMERYKYHNPDNYIIPASMLTFSQEKGDLFVVTKDTTVIDRLEYGKFLHNLSVKVTKGVSVERMDYESGMNVAAAWTSASGDATGGYGSPGMPNRAVKSGMTRSVTRIFERIPEVFTPDGDGFEDVVELLVTDEGADFVLKLSVCDASGRLVRTIADGIPVHSQGTFTWDGTLADQRLAPAGIYAVICKIVYSDGRSRTFREACVVSR